MSKKISVKNVAEDIFERYPGAEKVYVTADGQGFFDGRMAKNHARNNRSGKVLEVKEFIRPEEMEEEELKRKTVKELEAEIKVATLEELETIEEEEQSSDTPRSSVYKLIEKRRAELTNEDEV